MSKKLGEGFAIDGDEAVKIVEQLHLAKRDQVGLLRAAAVQVLEVGLVVRPANAIDRDQVVASGRTQEFRATSVVAVVPRPITVGSFFLLEFERAIIDLPPILACCDQCRVVVGNNFEARFSFLEPAVVQKSAPTA